MLFVSPRNSREAHLNLFDKTNCRIVWFAEPFGPTIESWLKEREMRAHQVGSVEEWLPENGDISTPHFPFDETFEKAQWEPLAVLHTSGSTGLPKPVIIKHVRLSLSPIPSTLLCIIQLALLLFSSPFITLYNETHLT